MTPQDLIERRNLSARQVESWAFENFEVDPFAAGTGYDRRNNYARLIRNAVPFWWEDSMLALAMASPLPPNYTIPEPPYDACWMAFEGTDSDGWGYVLVGKDFPPFQIAPQAAMRERFVNYDESTLYARMLIFLASPYVTFEHRRITNKGARRRVGSDEARFVVLRQPKSNPRGKDHTAVEWGARWMVRGHYRNQWYPSEGTHRTIWVASYIKGPADKPIREPAYRVAR